MQGVVSDEKTDLQNMSAEVANADSQCTAHFITLTAQAGYERRKEKKKKRKDDAIRQF